MPQFFELQPEVAGFQGSGTVVTNTPELQAGLAFVPEVAHLDYEFDGWLGDDIIALSFCYLVSDVLAAAMEQANLTGYRLEDISVSTTDVFDRWQSQMVGRPIPKFIRVLMDGKMEMKGDHRVISWSGHDICFGHRVDWVPPETPEEIMTAPRPNALVITARAMAVFKGFQIDNCDVDVLEGV